ncbi:MAG: hypothetical protein JWN56_482 [Sphingobacteriales bacterium]|nr:hypothetical protein [Sphingobacteriales bacterium]
MDSQEPLPGVIVKLKFGKDSIKTVTDVYGIFSFYKVNAGNVRLTASFIGYETYIKDLLLDKPSVQLEPINLKVFSSALNEVIITGITPVKAKEDTVEYDASAFKTRPGDAAEEMIKKLPGVTVDKDGNVTVQGKPITKIRVNGKDFFGGDVAYAIQNLPADIIKNLQIIDDYGEKAKLTKIKSGEPEKVLNINIQPGKKRGYFTQATGGLGDNDRFIIRARGNKFKEDKQVSFNGSINNTNTRGGGGDGFTDSKNLGLNYKNELGKKITVYGDYRFNSRDNNTIRSSYRQTFFSDYTQFNKDNNSSNNFDLDHNLTANMEFKIDTMNFLKVSPSFTYKKSRSSYDGINNSIAPKLNILSDNSSNNGSKAPSLGYLLFFNHKFAKKGRNFSFNADGNSNRNDNDRDVRNTYTNTDSADQLLNVTNQYQNIRNTNSNDKYGLDVSYMEPVGKSSYIEVSHHLDYIDTKNNRDIFDIDPLTQREAHNDSISNNFVYAFLKKRTNINYRIERKKLDFFIGLSMQQVSLNGDDLTRNNSTQKNFNNWIPNGRFAYRFKKTKVFTASFDTWTNQPSFNQIQPIVDKSNIRNEIYGNVQLKPEFTNRIHMEYKQSSFKTGDLLFTNFSYSNTLNKIVNNRVRFETDSNIINRNFFLNVKGFYTINSFYSYSKPLFEKKLTITYEGGANYSNNISYVDNERNLATNLVVNQGFKVRTDIEDFMNTEFKSSYMVNATDYSVQSFSDRHASRLTFGVEGRSYFFKNWTLGYDFSKTINKGYNNLKNPNILSVYLERQFLEKDRANIRMQGFDLFNQNTGISRDVYDNVIADSQTNRLARYFLLTLSVKLQKFGS